MVLFDNLDREQKTLLFTAHRTILVCEVGVNYNFCPGTGVQDIENTTICIRMSLTIVQRFNTSSSSG